MEREKEYKEFTVIFVYSDEAHRNSFGIHFDNQEHAEGINSSTYRKSINIKVENKETTLVRIVGVLEPEARINSNPYGYFGIPNNYSFQESTTYYLKIITGVFGLEIWISENDPDINVEGE